MNYTASIHIFKPVGNNETNLLLQQVLMNHELGQEFYPS